MRTTVNLPDALVAAAKVRALAEGRTLSSLIAEGLRAVLDRPDPPAGRQPLPAFGNSDDGVKVDLLDREALSVARDAGGQVDADPLARLRQVARGVWQGHDPVDYQRELRTEWLT